MDRTARPAALAAAVLLLLLLPPSLAGRAEEAVEGLTMRLYGVRGLTLGHRSYWRAVEPVVHPEMVNDSQHPLFGAIGEEPVRPYGTVDELIERIKAVVEPEQWGSVEGTSIRALGEDTLVVVAPPALQDDVAAYLDRLQDDAGRTLTIEFQVVRVPAAEAARCLREHSALALADEDAQRLLAAWPGGPGVSVTAAFGQRVEAWCGREVAWVSDADVEVAQESTSSDPLVVVSNLGLMAEAMALPAPDGTVLLALDVALARIGAARTLVTVRSGRLEAPLHEVVRLRPFVRVPAAQWAVLEGAAAEGGDLWWLFLARVTPHPYEPTLGAASTVDLGPPSPPAQGPFSVRSYDVRDLDTPIRSVVGSVSPHVAPSRFTPPEPPALPEPTPLFPGGGAGLAELIRQVERGEAWEESAFIEARAGELHVGQRAEVHARIERTLQAVRRAVWTLVVTAEVLEVPEPLARFLGSEGVLSPAATQALEEARRAGDARLVDALRLTSIAGVRNAVTVGERVPYLRDYDVEIAQAAEIGNPRTSDLFHGVQLEIEAARSTDGGATHLSVEFVKTDLVRPIRTLSTPHGDVELPELAIQRVGTSVTAPLEGTVLVGSWGESGRRRLLLLTPRLR